MAAPPMAALWLIPFDKITKEMQPRPGAML